jgi:REP element-mobilizing transposase RayT
MSRKYKFYDSSRPYFVSFAVVHWIDIFIRRIYFDVMVDSFDYCINHKELILNAWCIMTNHIHLIIRSETNQLEDIMRDMKKFTSKKLVETIREHSQESRKEWLLRAFRKAGEANSNNTGYQVWQQHNHPVELFTNDMREKRLDYLHANPVKAGFVDKPEDWLYSSAKNYAGLQKKLDLELIK